MARSKEPSLWTTSCSLLMASLFAFSASVQLNDPDWYLWFPLYALASAVNLLLVFVRHSSRFLKRTAQLVFWCGLLLLAKVVVEDHVLGIAGYWSLNMEERVVREKLGSALVLTSMFLQLQASMDSDESSGEEGKIKGSTKLVVKWAEYGEASVIFAAKLFFLLCFLQIIVSYEHGTDCVE